MHQSMHQTKHQPSQMLRAASTYFSLEAAIRARRKRYIRFRFRALVRKVINNLPWLQEEIHPAKMSHRKSTMFGRKITLEHIRKLNKPASERTTEDCIEIYKILHGFKLFRKYPDHVQRKLVKYVYFAFFKANHVIVKEGQKAEAIYYVLNGECQVEAKGFHDDDLSQNVIDRMAFGGMFGEVALLNNLPRLVTVTSLTPLELLYLKKEDFNIVLRHTVQSVWDETMHSLKSIPYFRRWNEVELRTCLIQSKLIDYTSNQLVFGDGVGSKHHVYFIVRGTCMLVENICVRRREIRKDTFKYSLFDETKEHMPRGRSRMAVALAKSKSVIAACSSIRKQRLGVKFSQSLTSGPSKHDLIMSSIRRFWNPHHRINKDLYKTIAGKMKTAMHSVETDDDDSIRRSVSHATLDSRSLNLVLPDNVKNYFVSSCFFFEHSCFNIGESMTNRRMVAFTDRVQCLVMPRYLLKEAGNLWKNLRHLLESRVPSQEQLFENFMTQRRWRNYKKNFVNSLLKSRRPVNSIHSVPLSIRIRHDFRYSDDNDIDYLFSSAAII